MTQGRLIILEGPDGVGKSTTAKVLVEHLRAAGSTPVHLFALPGNEPGTLGRLVHDLHHRSGAHGITAVDPTSLQLLHAAAHIDAIRTSIQPAYYRGSTIIMDRFWWSTIVYGRLAGVDEFTLNLLEQLARHHWDFATPTAAYVLFGTKKQAQQATDGGLQLRSAYRAFIDSIDVEFPVHQLECQGDSRPYSQQIIADLAHVC